MQKNIRAAAVQMISSTDPDANIDTMKRLVRQAAEQGADWVLLPEYWPLMGRKDTDKLTFAEPLVGSNFSETRCARFQTTLSETAAECGVVLFGGTVPLQSPDKGKVMNTMLVYDCDGTQIGLYHKMHLFGFSGLGGHHQRRRRCTEIDCRRRAACRRSVLRLAFSRVFPRPAAV